MRKNIQKLIKFSILAISLIVGFAIIHTPSTKALTIADYNGIPSACPNKSPNNYNNCNVFINNINVNGFNDNDTSESVRYLPIEGNYIIPGQTITIQWNYYITSFNPSPDYFLVKYGCGNTVGLSNDDSVIADNIILNKQTKSQAVQWLVPNTITKYQYCKIWIYAKSKTPVGVYSTPTVGVSNTRAFAINVVPPPASCSINSFSASNTNINSGDNVTLSWNTSNCNSCSASASPYNSYWVNGVSTYGSKTIYNLTNSTTFTLTCSGSNNSDTRNVTVNVQTPPPPPPASCSINSFSASNTNINSGDNVTLSWNTSNCNSCSASASPYNSYWVNGVNTYGSKTIYNLTNSTTFTLTCSNNNNSDTKNISVTVQPPLTRYTCNANYQCVVDTNGVYTSLTSCQNNCVAPIRYNCNTITYQCYQATNGTYGTYNDCLSACQPPLTRYTCNANYQCVVDTNGVYTSLTSCQNNCIPLTQCSINSFSASNTNINSGDNVTLSWNTSNCNSCSASASPYNSYWVNGVNTYGSKTIYNLTNSTTFTLTCSGSNNSDTRNVTVYAQTIQPSLSFWADNYVLNQGDSTYLRWIANNSSYCVASNGWGGNLSTSGSKYVTPSQTTTYTLTCYATNGASISQSVVIYVNSSNVTLSFIKLGRNVSQGNYNYSKVVQAQEGDTLEFYLAVIAGNNQDLTNVVVTDPLSQVFTYIPGSTKINGVSINDDSITTGLNLGNIARGSYKIVTFRVKANNPGTNFTYTNNAKVTVNNNQVLSDTSTITYGVVAGASTVETGAEDTVIIAFILSFIFTLILWYYLKFTEKGKLVLANAENKIREIKLEMLRRQRK